MSVDRFLWKNCFELPYLLIRPTDKEVKGFVVLLHGVGDNPANFAKIAARLSLDDVAYVLPRAPFPTTARLPDPSSGTLEVFTGYSWIDVRESEWPDRGASFSTVLVSRILQQLRAGGPKSPPLVLVGFRQGAGLATLWAATNPGEVAALVLIAGYADPPVREALGAPWGTLEGVPCLALVGAEDPDETEGGWLAAAAARMGARLHAHRLSGGIDVKESDWEVVRRFVRNCVSATSEGGASQ